MRKRKRVRKRHRCPFFFCFCSYGKRQSLSVLLLHTPRSSPHCFPPSPFPFSFTSTPLIFPPTTLSSRLQEEEAHPFFFKFDRFTSHVGLSASLFQTHSPNAAIELLPNAENNNNSSPYTISKRYEAPQKKKSPRKKKGKAKSIFRSKSCQTHFLSVEQHTLPHVIRTFTLATRKRKHLFLFPCFVTLIFFLFKWFLLVS